MNFISLYYEIGKIITKEIMMTFPNGKDHTYSVWNVNKMERKHIRSLLQDMLCENKITIK